MLELHALGHAMGASMPMAELMREDEKEEEEGEGMEEDRGKCSSSTDDLVLGQAPVLQWAMPTTPEFWALGPSIRVEMRGPPASSGAWGKVPAMQAVPLPPEMDEELVWQLQEEEWRWRRRGWGETLPPWRW